MAIDIFYADDNPFLAELADDFLAGENLNHLSMVAGAPPPNFNPSETLQAVPATELLKVIKKVRPKIILLDFDMGAITGLEILKTLHAENPDQFITREEILAGAKLEQGKLLSVILSADINGSQAELQEALNQGSLVFLLSKRLHMHEAWLELKALAVDEGSAETIEEFHQKACKALKV